MYASQCYLYSYIRNWRMFGSSEKNMLDTWASAWYDEKKH